MAETATRQHAAQPAADKAQRSAQPGPQAQPAAGEAASLSLPSVGTRFDDPLLDPRLGVAQRVTVVLQLQRAHGNRYVQRLLDRAAARAQRAECPDGGDEDAPLSRLVAPALPPAVARHPANAEASPFGPNRRPESAVPSQPVVARDAVDGQAHPNAGHLDPAGPTGAGAPRPVASAAHHSGAATSAGEHAAGP